MDYIHTRLRNLRKRIADLLGRVMHSDPEMAEFFLGLLGLIWGVFLTLFGTFSSTPSYRLLALVGPEWFFGLLIASIGCMMWIAMLYKNLVWRQRCAMLSFSGWLMIWVSLALSNWRGTGSVTYAIIWLAAAWTYTRLRLAERSATR